MVMSFVLHPLSHYNSIIESRAWFLISLIKNLSINFPSHFILSLINVYRDTRDKLIFPSAITWILHHLSIPYPESSHFIIIGAISAASVRRSKAQLLLKRPCTEMATPLALYVPSTSALSSSSGGVMLAAFLV